MLKEVTILHVGEYVSKYARDYIKQYVKSGNTDYVCCVPCKWTGGSDGKGIWQVCCTTGVQYMYKKALGIELTEYGWSTMCPTTFSDISNSSSTLHKYFDVITKESDLKAGDIVCNDGHNEMFIGNDEHFNSGYAGHNPVALIEQEKNSLKSAGGAFDYALRLKKSVQVDPSGKVTGTGEGIVGKKVDYSNFYFNGIPDGKYSLASRESIFEILINALKELINFFTGLIGYLFRGLIIGIISVFDRLINNTIESVNDSPKSLQESGVQATNADDPYSMNRSVTIEGLIFNDIDLFDINIFKVD